MSFGRWWHISAACTASALYVLLARHNTGLFTADYHLSLLYNGYYLSLLHGRLDVPVRLIGGEGHFLHDGTAFVYFGIFPALLRGFFQPFVDLTQVGVGRAVVLVFSLLSAGFCHLWLYRRSHGIIADMQPGTARGARVLVLAMAIAVWLATPMLLLSGSGIVFHEPIMIALLITILYLAGLVRVPLSCSTLLALAALAGVMLFVRPHLAIILYSATLAAMGLFTMRHADFKKSLKAFVLPVSVLGFAGLALLWLNALRFGDPWLLHGTAAGNVVYGFTFLGIEDANAARHQATGAHGIFNVLRVLPNALTYSLSAYSLTENIISALGLGHIRKQPFASGALAHYAPWFMAAALGGGLWLKAHLAVQREDRRRMYAAESVIAFSVCIAIAITTLSYYSVTVRYTAEIWIAPFVISILSLSWWLPKCATWVHKLGKAGQVLIWAVIILFTTWNLSFALDYSRGWLTTTAYIDGVLPRQLCETYKQQSRYRDTIRDDFCRDPAAFYREHPKDEATNAVKGPI